ncbi:hypothetical protein [Rossellomorea aquimaris]|uniref:hypothetical protein n=1 Tax=Rossellomorea aquimaris TaxID=189382 RepID=UPI0007D06A03|nr:hypothetical protein [Rossellomorea aquimaris]
MFWLISTLLSFLGFFLIENVFTVQPNTISGNGNLGILIIMLFSPIFIVSYYLTFKLVRKKLKDIKNKKILLVILFFSLVLLLLPISNYINDLVFALGGDPSQPESRIYRFGWFNQYTNSMFFNGYTLLFSYVFTIIIGVLFIKNS